jgi:hypothetical protein
MHHRRPLLISRTNGEVVSLAGAFPYIENGIGYNPSQVSFASQTL